MPDRMLDRLLPVELRSAADVVFERLQGLILDGSFQPGDRLPSETELAARLRVGRSTVREAKKALMVHGLLESRGKLGTFVLALPSDPAQLPGLRDLLADPALSDVHESRQIVEVNAIQLATTRASAADIAELHATLDQIESAIGHDNADVWLRLIGFHRRIVRASGNKVLLSLFDLLAHLLRRHQVPFYGSVAELHTELQSHRLLVDLMAQRDPEAAAAEMRHHLDSSDQLRRSALDKLRAEDEPT